MKSAYRRVISAIIGISPRTWAKAHHATATARNLFLLVLLLLGCCSGAHRAPADSQAEPPRPILEMEV